VPLVSTSACRAGNAQSFTAGWTRRTGCVPTPTPHAVTSMSDQPRMSKDVIEPLLNRPLIDSMVSRSKKNGFWRQELSVPKIIILGLRCLGY